MPHTRRRSIPMRGPQHVNAELQSVVSVTRKAISVRSTLSYQQDLRVYLSLQRFESIMSGEDCKQDIWQRDTRHGFQREHGATKH